MTSPFRSPSRRRAATAPLATLLVSLTSVAAPLAAQLTPELMARVSVKRILGPGVTLPANASHTAIAHWVDDASSILHRTAGISLLLTEVVDVNDPGTPSFGWFDLNVPAKAQYESYAVSHAQQLAWRPDAINVYVVNSFGNVATLCSFVAGQTMGDDDTVFFSGGAAEPGVLLAHELGHYFTLRHTHANHENYSCPGIPGASDCVADTPNDANPYSSFCSSAPCSCAEHLSNLVALGYTANLFDRVRYNAMSYHCGVTPMNAVITSGQAVRMRQAATLQRGHVLGNSRWNAIPWGSYWAESNNRDPLIGDFDGDGRADRGVHDPSNGAAWVLSSATGQPYPCVLWGVPVPGMTSASHVRVGDFDGDGRSDRLFVQPTGEWYVLRTSACGQGTGAVCLPWGWAWAGSPPFIPVVGKFDTDAITDVGIYKTNPFGWFIRSSQTCQPNPSGPWGAVWPGQSANHLVCIADFDGDGRDDRGLVDPTTQAWLIIPASSGGLGTGVPGIPWGATWSRVNTNCDLVVGDYDGDGRADRAAYNRGTCEWHVLLTGSNLESTVWMPCGKPVAADWDGDGKTDRAILSGGNWFVLASSNLGDSAGSVPGGMTTTVAGGACGGSGPAPELHTTRPVIGGNFLIGMESTNANALVLTFFGQPATGSIVLPGCSGQIAFDLGSFALVGLGLQHVGTLLGVTADANLVGSTLMVQGLAIDGAAFAGTTAGVLLTIGDH